MLAPIIRSVSIISHCGTSLLDGHAMPHMTLFNGKFVARIEDQYENPISALRNNYHALKKVDRVALLAAFCAHNLNMDKDDRNLMISMGSSRGATITQEKALAQFYSNGSVPLLTSPQTTLGNISAAVASVLERRSFQSDHSVTCSSAIFSICNALAWLRSNMADIVIAGASEAPISPFTIAQIDALGISQQLEDDFFPCKPFGANETINSFVLGEGAGLAFIELSEPMPQDLVIESVGYCFSDPPSMTGIDSNGGSLIKSMQMALDNMQTNNPVDLILAHAPGTIKGDRAEFNAIDAVFGMKKPYIFSSKWMLGHTYAASAMMNISIAEELLNGKHLPKIPFQVYLDQSDTAPNDIRKIMINASGFGGNSMTLILSKGLLS